MSYCKVIILGNLTRDPELRYLPKGTAVCNGAVAVNRKWTSESGEKQEEVSFFEFAAFGKTAEIVSQYFAKGKPIMIEGRLQQQSWEDKETGKNRTAIKVIVETVVFIPGGGEKKEAGVKAAPRQALKAATPSPAPAPSATDDDVPF